VLYNFKGTIGVIMSDSKTTKETWKNAGAGEVWINVIDPHTQRLKHVPVRSGNKIMITTEERQINQDRAASSDKDFFTNGTLTPVRLVDTAEDYAEIASNPNLLSEEDMRDMFKLKAAQFKARLADITNAIAISRMAEMAKAEESGLNVTMAQFKALEQRLAELRGGVDVTEVTQTSVAPAGIPAPQKTDIDFD
jgi:hypothetical protein